MVRAKFRVISVTQHEASGGHHPETVKLMPAYGKGNEAWSKATPSGSLEMQISNPSVLGKFKPGEHFYVDFSPAPAHEPTP